MLQVRFIGCLHFGHRSIAKWRGFNDDVEHDEYLINSWNSVVHEKDLTYILGDITMENKEYFYQLSKLNGKKIVVLGNHDLWRDIPELLKYVDGVAGAIKYKGFMLTHVPIHVSEIGQYRGNIHAHIHHNTLANFEVNKRYDEVDDNPIISTEGKYFNVDAGTIKFIPKTIDDLLNK